MSEIDAPTKFAISTLGIVSDESQIEATQSDDSENSVWLHQGMHISSTTLTQIRECSFLRLVRIDKFEDEIVILCDIIR